MKKWLLQFVLCLGISLIITADVCAFGQKEQEKVSEKRLTPDEAKAEIKKLISQSQSSISSLSTRRKKAFELRDDLSMKRFNYFVTINLYDTFARGPKTLGGIRLPKEIKETDIAALERDWAKMLEVEKELNVEDEILAKNEKRIFELQEMAGLPVTKGRKSPIFDARFKYVKMYYDMHINLLKRLGKMKLKYAMDGEAQKGVVGGALGKSQGNPKDKKLKEAVVRENAELTALVLGEEFMTEYMKGVDDRLEIRKDLYVELGTAE